ncbi:hypothetical protein FN846DRAFT_891626 [Sphaerosporella brunnea]|uniref:t-SNARE coiled-coil homology domain-containing protein n=1 Tax=Sphaerosporella brunnea TaxID=1250544 RepID=A0A5J5ESW8_9PEZI|nr:hypothetical protein FN846DRAFT_891626 [Sphaerosporella brunnea]
MTITGPRRNCNTVVAAKTLLAPYLLTPQVSGCPVCYQSSRDSCLWVTDQHDSLTQPYQQQPPVPKHFGQQLVGLGDQASTGDDGHTLHGARIQPSQGSLRNNEQQPARGNQGGHPQRYRRGSLSTTTHQQAVQLQKIETDHDKQIQSLNSTVHNMKTGDDKEIQTMKTDHDKEIQNINSKVQIIKTDHDREGRDVGAAVLGISTARRSVDTTQ